MKKCISRGQLKVSQPLVKEMTTEALRRKRVQRTISGTYEVRVLLGAVLVPRKGKLRYGYAGNTSPARLRIRLCAT